MSDTSAEETLYQMFPACPRFMVREALRSHPNSVESAAVSLLCLDSLSPAELHQRRKKALEDEIGMLEAEAEDLRRVALEVRPTSVATPQDPDQTKDHEKLVEDLLKELSHKEEEVCSLRAAALSVIDDHNQGGSLKDLMKRLPYAEELVVRAGRGAKDACVQIQGWFEIMGAMAHEWYYDVIANRAHISPD